MELIRDAGIIIICLSGAYFLIRLLRRRKSCQIPVAGKMLVANEEAKATILNIEQTGLTRNQQYQVNIQMQVFPEKGRNFVVEIKEILSLDHFSILHTGVSVRVSYNPVNLKEVSLIKTVY